MSTIDDLIEQAEAVNDAQRELIRDLKAFKSAMSKSGVTMLKHPDGRLTEEGVRHLYAGFEAGKGPTALARALEISVPAVIYRRSVWERQNKSRRKR